jgi:hypothetical protein
MRPEGGGGGGKGGSASEAENKQTKETSERANMERQNIRTWGAAAAATNAMKNYRSEQPPCSRTL